MTLGEGNTQILTLVMLDVFYVLHSSPVFIKLIENISIISMYL